MLSRDQILTPPEPDELRDRRLIHALRPTPLAAHKIAAPPAKLMKHVVACEIGILAAITLFILEKVL